MRDVNRIYSFMSKLTELWVTYCPDLRFGQLMMNIFNDIDPFYLEEDEVMEVIEKWFEGFKKVKGDLK